MQIKLPKSLIDKYLNTMELNEQVASFYNDYFDYFNDYELNDQISLYSYIKECLEIDEDDPYFKNFEKEYNLENIEELNINDFLNNSYIQNIKIEKPLKYKGYILFFNHYDPYYLFVYDEIKVNKTQYYKETYKVGYFKKAFNYIDLSKNNITWMSTIPHEINTMKEDINTVKNNVLVLGLGIGYFSYLISNKISVKNITILENDQEIISIFSRFILPNFKNKTKINIIKCDALEFLKNNDLSAFDYVYVDLYHNANDGIYFYYQIKNIENNIKSNTKFLFWIEENILCLIRRITLSIIRDNIYSKNYENIYNSLKDNDFNKIVKTIFNNINTISINSKDELDTLLDNDSLKKIILENKGSSFFCGVKFF